MKPPAGATAAGPSRTRGSSHTAIGALMTGWCS